MFDKRNIIIGFMFLIILLMGYLLIQSPKIIKETVTREKRIYIKADAVITGGTSASITPDGSVAVSGVNLSIKTNTDYTEKDKEKSKTDYSIHGLAFGIGTYLSLQPNILNLQDISYNLENWSVELSYINNRDILTLSYNHIDGKPDLLKISYQRILILF